MKKRVFILLLAFTLMFRNLYGSGVITFTLKSFMYWGCSQLWRTGGFFWSLLFLSLCVCWNKYIKKITSQRFNKAYEYFKIKVSVPMGSYFLIKGQKYLYSCNNSVSYFLNAPMLTKRTLPQQLLKFYWPTV